VYVRNISFAGANRINDEVLRREMRQLEGGWLSNTSLERSKQRIQRLPYVKSVEFETTPVAGSPDLVDVNYKIEEGPASQLSGGIGYSETYKFMLNGSYADADFLGTGERIAVNLNGGAFQKVYSVSHTNPYTNIDNLQRTISVTYSDVTQFVSSSSTFSSRTLSFGPTWAYPIAETMYIRAGAAFDSSQLLTNSLSSALQAQQWVQQNGHPYSRLAHDDATNNEYVFYGSSFKSVELVAGWDWDTRNRTLFADRVGQAIARAHRHRGPRGDRHRHDGRVGRHPARDRGRRRQCGGRSGADQRRRDLPLRREHDQPAAARRHHRLTAGGASEGAARRCTPTRPRGAPAPARAPSRAPRRCS